MQTVSREHWMLAEIIKAAARSVDAAYSAADGEQEYMAVDFQQVVRQLIDGENSLSRFQLENLRDLCEQALNTQGAI